MEKRSAAAMEFDSSRPLGSMLEVLRELFLRPRSFFLSFSSEGEIKGPVIFILLVTAISAIISLFISGGAALLGYGDPATVGIAAAQGVGFMLLAPLMVAFAAAFYLLAIRTFVGEVANFRQVYRIAAHAYGPMIFFGIPGIGAFAFAYGAMLLMVLAVRGIYRTSLMNALITALVGFVPVASALMYLYLVVTGVAFG